MSGLNKPPLYHQMRALGLNVVHPPRASLRALSILMRHGKTLSRWGELETVFESDQLAPKVNGDQVVSNLFGQTKETYAANLGLNILESIVSKMGLSLGVEAACNNANELQFSYQNISSEYCDAASIDRFINSSELYPDAKSTQRYLLQNKLYVVTEVYRSNRIAVEAKGGRDASLDFDLPKSMLEDASVEFESVSSTRAFFQGNTPLTIGIRALQIGHRSNGHQRWYELSNANTKLQSKSPSVVGSKTAYKPLKIDPGFDYVD